MLLAPLGEKFVPFHLPKTTENKKCRQRIFNNVIIYNIILGSFYLLQGGILAFFNNCEQVQYFPTKDLKKKKTVFFVISPSVKQLKRATKNF